MKNYNVKKLALLAVIASVITTLNTSLRIIGLFHRFLCQSLNSNLLSCFNIKQLHCFKLSTYNNIIFRQYLNYFSSRNVLWSDKSAFETSLLRLKCIRNVLWSDYKIRSFWPFLLFLAFFPLKFRSFLAFFSRSNSAHFLHFLFRSNSAHFLHFFPLKFRSFRSKYVRALSGFC